MRKAHLWTLGLVAALAMGFTATSSAGDGHNPYVQSVGYGHHRHHHHHCAPPVAVYGYRAYRPPYVAFPQPYYSAYRYGVPAYPYAPAPRGRVSFGISF